MATHNKALYGRFGWLVLAGCLATVSSCGPIVDLGGESGPPARIFDLSVNASNLRTASVTAASVILIEEPTASSVIDKDRVAVRLDDGEIQYLGGMRLADKPSRLIRRAIKGELDRVEGLTALGRGALDIPSDYRLKLVVHDFQIISDGAGQEKTVVSLQALMIDASGALIASRRFDQSERIASTAPTSVMAGLRGALSLVVEDLGAWVVERIE